MRSFRYMFFGIILVVSSYACGTTPYSIPIAEQTSTYSPMPTEMPVTTAIPVGIEVNTIAPNFVLSDTYGNTYELWQLRGSPILINFWATWCGPCLAEMPAIQSLSERYRNSGLLVLAINGDGESRNDIESYQYSNGLNFPLLIDTDRYAATEYNILAFPTTFFLDENGIIQYVNEGSMEEQDFENILTSTILADTDFLTLNLPGNIWSVDLTESHIYNYSSMSEQIFSNFTVQVDVEITSEAYEFHGVYFRQQDGENFYSFRITPDGYFAFDVWHSGDYSFETILGPTHSDFINHGTGQVNVLKVDANNENFDLYINDQYVGSVSDTRFLSGTVGVVSCTCDGSNSTSANYYNFSLIERP